ncbi:ATP-grasp domain-containing protein [Bryobacter aggregatus]|uniref:ATP-grasp domain-containing protein n=1 Tax=Bryobacter aggregatus TaxID=360054 RepID=UPI0004E164D7|nr:ATP-dependent carboxylate-amine ligase [Bryobacter aggregatus]
MSAPLAIFYEHPAWFEKLFAELESRSVAYDKIHAGDHFYRPGENATGWKVVFNRMSPSAYRRGTGSEIFHTTSFLGDLELSGIRVINGSKAFQFEISKALQLSLLQKLGLRAPKSRVLHNPQSALAAVEGLRFPVVIKPNIGGSGAGVVRYNSREELAAAVAAGRIDLGLDHVGLLQEFVPARGGHITRVETLNGKFLYAINVYLSGETFDLCPADICQTAQGETLDNACVIEGAKAGLKVEAYQPPPEVIAAIERIVAATGIDVGGIEYMVDDRDGEIYYYDVNALSNFVADAPRVIGFDPFVKLADYLLAEVERG